MPPDPPLLRSPDPHGAREDAQIAWPPGAARPMCAVSHHVWAGLRGGHAAARGRTGLGRLAPGATNQGVLDTMGARGAPPAFRVVPVTVVAETAREGPTPCWTRTRPRRRRRGDCRGGGGGSCRGGRKAAPPGARPHAACRRGAAMPAAHAGRKGAPPPLAERATGLAPRPACRHRPGFMPPRQLARFAKARRMRHRCQHGESLPCAPRCRTALAGCAAASCGWGKGKGNAPPSRHAQKPPCPPHRGAGQGRLAHLRRRAAAPAPRGSHRSGQAEGGGGDKPPAAPCRLPGTLAKRRAHK